MKASACFLGEKARSAAEKHLAALSVRVKEMRKGVFVKVVGDFTGQRTQGVVHT